MWFQDGNEVNLLLASSDKDYKETLEAIPGLARMVVSRIKDPALQLPMMELVLHGLAQYNVVGRNYIDNKLSFKDPISDIFNLDDEEEDDEG